MRLLVAVGTDDEYGLLPNSTQVYQTADMVKAFITVSGGDHLDTFVAATPQAQAVRDETVRFLQVALGSGSIPVTPAIAGLSPRARARPLDRRRGGLGLTAGSGRRHRWLEWRHGQPGPGFGQATMSMGVPGGIGASWARSLSCRCTQP